ncbi:MAG: peroxiredoxin [Chloroflexota bacterium]|nr:peroxiredoxin [Chloroflexota bacterium]
MLTIGQPAPDFALVNQEGARVRLSEQRGKPVAIFAFPKANEMSFGCIAQACGFRDEFPRIEASGAVVFGVSADSVGQLKKWHTGRKLPYDLLSDPDHAMLEAYGAWGISVMGIVRVPVVNRSHWVIDGDGILVAQQLNVAPGDSAPKVLEALQRLPSYT